jgi:demethylmenaquinone methyltransferase/2-methoxy-6-polyprenyl-1,4-benzoquinol methylase
MEPDRRLALEKYQRHAAAYDYRATLAERTRLWPRTRRRAIARLRLEPGDTALDVGCGTGLSFSLIQARIGPEGRLIGIELSPDMMAKARERVESSGWQNVALIESAAEEADIPVQADAVLFHFTHDILRSPSALDNVFRHMKRGGRVAAAGNKWAPWWVFPVNLYVWYIARHYVTTFQGFGRPWSELVRFVPDLRVEAVLFGGGYIVWGRVPRE